MLTDAATDGEPKALLAAIVTAPGAITAHNLRVRSSGGRNWVEVHLTVDPGLTVKQAHEVATEVVSAIRNERRPGNAVHRARRTGRTAAHAAGPHFWP